MIYRVILFLLFNFAGLAIGSLFTSNGVGSDWYLNLNKAPWTPPGWVFGAAWTVIMVCFAVYMGFAWERVADRTILVLLFGVQWILNWTWNPVFFKYHQCFWGLIIIVSLTILIGVILIKYFPELKGISILILPYFLWLLIATSLNAYIYFMN